MPETYLLDTNAAIAVLNQDASIDPFLDEQNDIYLSSITVGELYFGAENSGRVAENLQRIDEFESQRTVLVCDALTARYYARLRQQLKLKGRPIPENDKWIAAIALQHRLALLTRDAHFNEVDGLTVQSW
jgi:tRNA(fMet)-specific endonuclease VapC